MKKLVLLPLCVLLWAQQMKTVEYARRASDFMVLNPVEMTYQYNTLGWQVGGIPVCIAAGSQWYAMGTTDGFGGTIVAWHDARGSIYAQRLDSSGIPLWTINGISLFDGANIAEPEINLPAITTDESGGAIVASNIGVSNLYGIYCQRVSDAGVKLWGAGGVRVSTLYTDAHAQVQIFKEPNSVIITWSYQGDIYAQKVGLAGNAQWGINGVRVIDTVDSLFNATAVTDGAGGAIVCAIEKSSAGGFRILAQRVSSTGSPLWGSGGVDTGLRDWFLQVGVSYPKIVSDGSGGAIISSASSSYFPTWTDIYAQRVDGNGNRLWGPNGVAVIADGTAHSQQSVSVKSDGVGGAILSWMDTRPTGTDWNIYAQRINTLGNSVWTGGGVSVSIRSGNQYWPFMVYDWDLSIIIAWNDGYPEDLYAQKLNASDGSPVWTINGIPVITEPSRNILTAWGGYKGHLVSTTGGNAIIFFNDDRNGNFDIYAQIIPPPAIGIEEENKTQKPKAVSQNLEIYPNPFRQMTEIRWQIGDNKSQIQNLKSQNSLEIYDATGRLVKQFNHLTNYRSPFNQVVWFGDDDSGNKLPPGVYFVRLEADDFQQTEKVILSR